MDKQAMREVAISNRRAAREVAVIRVYSEILGGKVDYELIGEQAGLYDFAKKIDFSFADTLFDGVSTNNTEIDSKIDDVSKGWKLERLSNIDLCILRVALYEILYCEEIPVEVSINEAVELAKKYGGDKSAPYINGVLGTIVRSL